MHKYQLIPTNNIKNTKIKLPKVLSKRFFKIILLIILLILFYLFFNQHKNKVNLKNSLPYVPQINYNNITIKVS